VALTPRSSRNRARESRRDVVVSRRNSARALGRALLTLSHAGPARGESVLSRGRARSWRPPRRHG
jgi:hypothetical protein